MKSKHSIGRRVKDSLVLWGTVVGLVFIGWVTLEAASRPPIDQPKLGPLTGGPIDRPVQSISPNTKPD